MGLNQKAEDGSLREAKKGRATVFPGEKKLVKKMMLDKMVQCVSSCCGRCLHCCSQGSTSNKQQGSNDGSVGHSSNGELRSQSC
ncbi:hypothetical protein E1A91_A02G079900v1 [Gossypium mustelinum]|uniref:Uncharacterized protein n=2 Tax=Gossypium TaxID=3633 RepID=A0A5J5WMU6_GOSBA|nr:hypothetical protein ES319_A02G076200v1 [Gossypium barbadense]TYJ45773.1 hypothetical protein E1A91_A02G079900v1 [Gossypium mustelinum]